MGTGTFFCCQNDRSPYWHLVEKGPGCKMASSARTAKHGSACSARRAPLGTGGGESRHWLQTESSCGGWAKSSGKQMEKVVGKTTFLPPTLWDSDPVFSGRGGILELWLSCKSRAISES